MASSTTQTVTVGPVSIGQGSPLTIIAGPCLAESVQVCLSVGEAVRDCCAKLGFGFIFKASFDKANRSSIASQRGTGLDEGLAVLAQVRDELGVAVTTDIHEPAQASAVAEVVDLLQIPAFLCRQTDLLVAAAQTRRPINVKKGQFMSPAEMVHVIAKLKQAAAVAGDDEATGPRIPGEASGGSGSGGKPRGDSGGGAGAIPGAVVGHIDEDHMGGGVVVTERGTFFGYQRLVNDFVGLGDLMELGHPVCFDVTHSTQMPGADRVKAASGGRPERAGLLARCAVAAGVQALFIETHPDPSSALSDAATMLPIERTAKLLEDLAKIHEVVRTFSDVP